MSLESYIIISVKELLNSSLKIPYYQRPYKWTEKNVNQLISDIIEHKDKKKYRLGTLILHNDEKTKTLNIGRWATTGSKPDFNCQGPYREERASHWA